MYDAGACKWPALLLKMHTLSHTRYINHGELGGAIVSCPPMCVRLTCDVHTRTTLVMGGWGPMCFHVMLAHALH